MKDKIYLNIGQSIKANSGDYYQIVSSLGDGGNSVAFLALCTSGIYKGILFSLKLFCNISDSRRQEKFLKEVNFLEKIDHPAIIRVYDKGTFAISEKQYPFVVSEYYPNTLTEIMKSECSLSDKLIYTVNLLSALCYLKNNTPKIVHRDIKPQNIFIKGRNAILGDFGLMKVLDEKDAEDSSDIKEFEVTAGAGMAFFYRTPDLIDYLNHKTQVTQKSDIFQLGLVIAQLFTGVNPCKKVENLTDDFDMFPLGGISSKKYGGLIAQNIKLMLEIDSEKRIDIDKLLDKWNGTLEIVTKELIEINGSL